jgi:hypothetical protein
MKHAVVRAGCDPGAPPKHAKAPSLPSHQPRTSPTPDLFHPREFRDLSVSLSIRDPKLHSIASSRLQLFGATIATPVSPPDIIVTDGMSDLQTRVRTVTVRELPWLSWSQKELSALMEPRPPAMVVADCTLKCRPSLKLMPELPQLCLGAVPRGYTTTPFSAIAARAGDHKSAGAARDALDFEADPPDGGYCELCLITFGEAAEHRRSKEHRRRATADAFQGVDEVIKQIAALARI